MNTVWVSCKGESPADSEFIGPVSYYPKQGFPGYYFPYENSEGYLSPLVAVHLERPKREYPHFLKFIYSYCPIFVNLICYIILVCFLAGILINIECRAWAKNINYRQKDKQGSVHFELMID